MDSIQRLFFVKPLVDGLISDMAKHLGKTKAFHVEKIWIERNSEIEFLLVTSTQHYQEGLFMDLMFAGKPLIIQEGL